MNYINMKLIVLAGLLCIIPTHEAKSTNVSCSSSTKHKNICTQETSESIPTNICVPNENIKQHFQNNPYSFVGNCSEFDARKIQTYACNAGMRFKSVNTVCIRKDRNNLASKTCGDSLNCSCTTAPPVDMAINYFNFEKASYTGSDSPSYIDYSLNTSTTDAFATASKSSGSEILKDGSALQFNMGSDFYGAEYFVDICIRNKNSEISSYTLDLSGSITFANSIFSKDNYISSSNLSAEVTTTCMTSDNKSSGIKAMSSELFMNGQRSFNGVSMASAKLCVVRHYFKENSTKDLRESSFKRVTIQTTTSLTPKNQSLLEFNTPVKFCNINYDSKTKKYSCEQWTSKTNDDFIAALKVKTFFGTNTYTGQCRSDCKPF